MKVDMGSDSFFTLEFIARICTVTMAVLDYENGGWQNADFSSLFSFRACILAVLLTVSCTFVVMRMRTLYKIRVQ